MKKKFFLFLRGQLAVSFRLIIFNERTHRGPAGAAPSFFLLKKNRKKTKPFPLAADLSPLSLVEGESGLGV